MAEFCTQRTREEALSELALARIPAYPINSPQDALDDPQVEAMGLIAPTPYPGLSKPAALVETPFRMGDSEQGFSRRPPALGEHTEEILSELGFSAPEIAELRAQEVI